MKMRKRRDAGRAGRFRVQTKQGESWSFRKGVANCRGNRRLATTCDGNLSDEEARGVVAALAGKEGSKLACGRRKKVC